jgi:hypothetical protein
MTSLNPGRDFGPAFSFLNVLKRPGLPVMKAGFSRERCSRYDGAQDARVALAGFQLGCMRGVTP